MQIKEGFELRNVCGEAVIIAHGKQNIDFSRIINLNESAAYLWRNVVGTEFDAERLAKLLLEEYDVSRDIALRDAHKVINDWREAGLAE